ncbi:MAG: hypothetical protein ABIN89_19410 [Chitinophagaceae bacterium]
MLHHEILSFLRVLFGVIAVIIFLSRAFVLLLGTIIIQPAQTITWKLQDPALVGNFSPAILGNPLIIKDATGTSLFFNGVNDGLILPTIPIDGWPRFTIEVLFKPASDGPPAPGFIHFQDKDANRGTVEIRALQKAIGISILF